MTNSLKQVAKRVESLFSECFRILLYKPCLIAVETKV